MTLTSLINYRLSNQQITSQGFSKPEQLLSYMCGMQAQDYAQAKWAVGLRLPDFSDADVEGAIKRKKIIRTWGMRGTLQFISAADIHWLTDLLAPKILSSTKSRYKQLGLDDKILEQCLLLLSRALKGNDNLTRKEIATILIEAKIPTNENRLSHILLYAVLKKSICFAPRRGKEFTFALLDEWIPKPKKVFDREQALEEITKRYFNSRGPATLKDFIWWTGLSVADAKAGLKMVRGSLFCEMINEQEYFFSQNISSVKEGKQSVFLLAAFDEYLIAYKDRSACLDPKFNTKAIYSNGIFHPTIVIGGQIVGIWRPIIKGKNIAMRSELFVKLTKDQQKLVNEEFEKYCLFVNNIT